MCKDKIYLGNNLDVLKTFEDNSIDSVVTDPPYGINFMNKKWDYDVPSVELWLEVIRVLKPGGHILCACGTRTQHRMAVNIEDAGFEIRDIVAWVYGSGFPKSLDIGKAVSKVMGEEVKQGTAFKTAGEYGNRNLKDPTPINDREQYRHNPKTEEGKIWQGWGTALKPAMELWTLARKPFKSTVAENVLKYGTGGINIDGCRVESDDKLTRPSCENGSIYSQTEKKYNTGSINDTADRLGRFPANLIHDGSAEVVEGFKEDAQRFFYTAKASQAERNMGLYGKVLDSLEIVLYNDSKESDLIWKEKITIQEAVEAKQLVDMALSLKKVIEEYGVKQKKDIDLNIVSYGKMYLEKYLKDIKYITEMKTNSIIIQETLNLLRHFTTKESIAEQNYEKMAGGNNVQCVKNGNILTITISEKTELAVGVNHVPLKLQLKIKEKESRNIHSTVKPLELMRYLVRLITPKGGVCLDPYVGSGTTAIACKKEKFDYIGIELDEKYHAIAEARIKAAIVEYDIFDYL